jgi:FdhD protein
MPPNEVARAVLPARVTRLSFSGDMAQGAERALPVETPVQIVYAPTPYAVMMASPLDLEDFAHGFSLTEGVIERAGDIRSVEIETDARGHRVVITLASDKLRTHMARARNLAGRTGCGVCGIEDIDQLPFARSRPAEGPPLRVSSIRRAIRSLDDHLPLGDLTRATHAAAWCDDAGDVKFTREDVGRHNALDKLIGTLMRAGVDPAHGFVVVTSRCSFEMVEKTAAFGARAIVAVSAPTSLALERARAHGMALVAVARADGALLFTDDDGIENDLTFEGARSA